MRFSYFIPIYDALLEDDNDDV